MASVLFCHIVAPLFYLQCWFLGLHNHLIFSATSIFHVIFGTLSLCRQDAYSHVWFLSMNFLSTKIDEHVFYNPLSVVSRASAIHAEQLCKAKQKKTVPKHAIHRLYCKINSVFRSFLQSFGDWYLFRVARTFTIVANAPRTLFPNEAYKSYRLLIDVNFYALVSRGTGCVQCIAWIIIVYGTRASRYLVGKLERGPRVTQCRHFDLKRTVHTAVDILVCPRRFDIKFDESRRAWSPNSISWRCRGREVHTITLYFTFFIAVHSFFCIISCETPFVGVLEFLGQHCHVSVVTNTVSVGSCLNNYTARYTTTCKEIKRIARYHRIFVMYGVFWIPNATRNICHFQTSKECGKGESAHANWICVFFLESSRRLM